MNDAPSLQCVDVVLGDSDLIATRKGYSLPCPFVKETQRDIKAGKLTVEAAWSQIEKTLKPIDVQKPKN